MRNVFIILALPISLLSCKKDRLQDEKEVLIGKWEWVRTETTYSLCNPPSYDSVILPDMIENSYELDFHKKGKFDFVTNGIIDSSKRLVFKHFTYEDYAGDSSYVFSIRLNNKDDNILVGWIYFEDDSLFTWSYPFETNIDVPCETNKSFFHKIE